MLRHAAKFAVLSVLALPAWAQTADPGRHAIIEREQRSDLFSLQLEQSQRALNLAPGSPTLSERRRLDLREQQDRERLGEEQLRQFDTQPGNQPGYDAARIERERRASALRPAPAWGPAMEPPRHWTPTLEKP